MAPPANGSVKPGQAGPSRGKLARGSKPIVPAIPLPFVKRRAAAEAAAAVAAAASASSVSSPVSPAVANPPLPAAPRAETKLPDSSAPANHDEPAPASPVAQEKSDGKPQGKADGPQQPPAAQINGQNSPVASSSDQTSSIEETSNTVKYTPSSDRPSQPTNEPVVVRSQPADHQSPTDAHEKPNGVATHNNNMNYRSAPYENHAGRPPPLASPRQYRLPPFQNQGGNRIAAGNMANDSHRGPQPHGHRGPPGIHQPHPSTGSVHFGNFHGSGSSSPAPPLSGGMVPPNMPLADGRPSFMPPPGGGYPPAMPYGTDMMSPTTFDQYGRPTMGHPGPETYPQYGNGYGPATPHSFHGSQASAPGDDNNAMYSQYPSGPGRAGAPGHAPGPRADQQPSNHQTTMYPGPPMEYGRPADDYDGLIEYIQREFASVETADCNFELRFNDDRAPPIRVLGHRLIFARSPTISNILRQQKEAAPIDPGSTIVVIETDNKWIRGEAFYIALQRLYGMHLFESPLTPEQMGHVSQMADRMNFSLSYAASGHVLQWPSIIRRGCDLALQLLHWQTLDQGMEFALEEYADKGSHDEPKYGDGSRSLLTAIGRYVLENLPRDFSLNTALPSSCPYARLPPYPVPEHVSKRETAYSAASIAAHAQLGKNRRSRQISGIQFGDLNPSGIEAPAAPNSPVSAIHDTISRVLLNLPFEYLKVAVDLSNDFMTAVPVGQEVAEHRYQVIKDVVAEREKRRLEAVAAVQAGVVAGWNKTLEQLSTPEQRHTNPWSVLGWQEEIVFGEGRNPVLSRNWVPVVNPLAPAPAAYP